MPSEVRVVGQKFLAKLNNGDTFALNPSDFSTHLKGGVTEEIKAVFNVQVEWYFYLRSYNQLYDDSANTLRIEQAGVDFSNEGFSVGDSVKKSAAGTNTSFTGDVVSLKVGEILLNNVVQTSGDLLVSGYYTNIDGSDPLVGTSAQTALNYKFGLIENDEPFNTLSKLTNTDQGYLIDGIGAALDFKTGISQGNNKAWVTGSVECAFVQLTPDKDFHNPQNTTQEFQINHIFIINPDYRDGEIDSITGIDTPPEDIFDGDRSIKYVFKTEFRTTLNNPNTSKIFDYDTQLGSVGYYGESYNGFPNGYSVDELFYSIGANAVNKISIGEITNIEFDIISSELTFTASTPVIVGHKSIINSLSYSNSPNDYNTQWTNESLRAETGDAPMSGAIIKNYEATFINSGRISIVFDIEFTNPQTRILNDGQNYVLYYTIADPTKTVDTGDKVTNRIDVNVYEKNGDISGLFDVEILEQYPLPYEFEKGVSTGFTSGKMFIEDEQFCYARIKVLNEYLGEDLDLLEDVTLDSLKFKIVAYNTVKNTWFDIRSLNIDLTDEILSGNIQNIELDDTRGFILTDDDIFNSLKVTTDNNNDGTWQYYDVEIGYKIPWQIWLELIGADTVFLDRSKSQNNLNQSAATYSFTNDYVIRFLIDADVETTGITTNYVASTGNFQAYDYNTDDQVMDAFSCVINTFNADGVALENNIIEKGFTEFRAVITPITPPIFSSSVDFNEVDDLWNRYAHGNLLDPSFGGAIRSGVWANDQANDTDLFRADAFTSFTKNDDLYTSSALSIFADQNAFAVYGCYSLLSYEFYSITGDMFSDENDNDIIKYDICFHVDEFLVEHTLSLVATTGGFQPQLGSSFDGTTFTSTIEPENAVASWSLVYNFGKRDCINLERFNTSKSGFYWDDAQVGDFHFEVNRISDEITINGDWTIDGVQFLDTINYNLNDNTITEKFKGFSKIGFSFCSQALGGFKEVILTNPASDYYAALRIETDGSPSDSGISELNTEVENTEDSLLMQIDGDENKARLSFDGSDFIIQGLVATAKIIDGEKYKFSAELRTRDLIV